MRIGDDIKIIRELLNITQMELASMLNVPFELINRWENNEVLPEENNIDRIYSFAFKKKIYLNTLYEHMFKDEYSFEDYVVLFHGAKNMIEGKIDLLHSKKSNDFGNGFYLGETFAQASLYITYSRSNKIYSFLLKKKDLKILKFGVSQDWMFAIAYYRGWFDKYVEHPMIKSIINKVEEADIIIAPIADNRMFDLIDEFVSGMITDYQCKHALSVTDLGYQYIIKTEKALANLKPLEEMFLCSEERKSYINRRLNSNKLNQDKVKIARMEYKGKGHYIEEILK